jgi:hypothetical protein
VKGRTPFMGFSPGVTLGADRRKEQEVRLEILNMKSKTLHPELLNRNEPGTISDVDLIERDYLMQALGLK